MGCLLPGLPRRGALGGRERCRTGIPSVGMTVTACFHTQRPGWVGDPQGGPRVVGPSLFQLHVDSVVSEDSSEKSTFERVSVSFL